MANREDVAARLTHEGNAVASSCDVVVPQFLDDKLLISQEWMNEFYKIHDDHRDTLSPEPPRKQMKPSAKLSGQGAAALDPSAVKVRDSRGE